MYLNVKITVSQMTQRVVEVMVKDKKEEQEAKKLFKKLGIPADQINRDILPGKGNRLWHVLPALVDELEKRNEPMTDEFAKSCLLLRGNSVQALRQKTAGRRAISQSRLSE